MRFLLWFFIFFIIFFRFITTRPKITRGQKIRITTKLLQEPIKYENLQVIKLYGLKISLPLFPEVNYGDQIVVEGVVEKGKLANPRLVSVIKAKGVLFKTRQKLISFFERSLPSPHSGLISGMVLGSKEGINKGFWENLKSSGTAHVVVASGMNVTLVAGFLLSLFLTVLPRKKAVLAVILGIWGYSALSGMAAPIVRAAIMGSLAFGAQGLGRINMAWRALFISVMLMLFIKPDWLTDLGFILSVVATTSLLFFEAKINRLIHFIPGLFREGMSSSLAAQIGVFPILYFTFGQFNIFSPIINALILWTVAPITVIGMLSGVLSFLSEPIAKLVLILSFPLTSWFIFVVERF